MSPNGSATAIAMPDTRSVASTSGQTPNRALANSGRHWGPVRNSTMDTSRKKATVSTASTTTMPRVVPTDTRPQRNRANSISRSCRRIALRLVPPAGEQLADGDADLRAPVPEGRSGHAPIEVRLHEPVVLVLERHVADLLDERRSASQIEVHERLEPGTLRAPV